ncbi:MAG: uroporphyrinogen-III synthase, partial [Pyrobaculum sp.]
MGRWTVVITSGRPSKAELLAKLVLKAGGDVVYLPVVEIESAEPENVGDLVKWAEVVIFLTGQSAWGLAGEIKKEDLHEKVVICRGNKATGNVKTYFGISCIDVGETTEGLLKTDIYRGRKVLVSFYGVVDQ